ncbi:hypothetical protein [Desulfosporosinus fructosivorans]|uniref:hypothetical protein n=1 Tax=Desulfosporosinus fructosivorans TaxID=2018669 RepID=UPI0018EEADCE|nr:hypothetical protein [Desulfosporosinus fructosivorans]
MSDSCNSCSAAELAIDPLLAELSDAGKIEEYQSPSFDQIAQCLAEQIKANSDEDGVQTDPKS